MVSAASVAFVPTVAARSGLSRPAQMLSGSSLTYTMCAASVVITVGLILNATLGWSWADPVAGLIIAAVAVREGSEAWRGKGCCAPTPPGAHGGAPEVGCGCGDGCADACCAPPATAAQMPGSRPAV